MKNILAEKSFFLEEFYSKLLKSKVRTASYLLCKISKVSIKNILRLLGFK